MQLNTMAVKKLKFGGATKMNISKEGLSLIKKFEGCPQKDGMAHQYFCAANVSTIGYGSTKLNGKAIPVGAKISMEEAEALLLHEMEEYEGYIDSLVEVHLHQYQFDALVAWVFNLGPSNLKASTLLKVLNSGDIDSVPAQFKRWNKAGGKVLEGLIRRREAEALLFEGKDWTQV